MAYFLTHGIDLGEQPNASQNLTRGDLPFSILNNDPLALGNSALMTQALGTYAGDGLSAAEQGVAAAISGLHGGGTAINIDSTLSAIANRKATDLVANFSVSAVSSALNHSDASWAADWSNGNGPTQQFRAAWEAALGSDTPDARYKMFVVASSNTSPSAIIQQLQLQSDFAATIGSAAMNTVGIAEYGGLWVVVVANPMSGYQTTVPGADGLAAMTDYGSGGSDVLYAGSRTANLYGLDGDDRIVGSVGADHLNGGNGDDVLTGGPRGPAATAGAAQPLTLQPGPEGQDLWVTNVFYGGGLDDDRLRVGGWGDQYNSLLKFDLTQSGLPAHVTSATLRLYTAGFNSGTATGFYLDEVHTAWDESYRWNSYALNYANIGQVSAPGLGWIDIDITQAVNDWLANPAANFGVQLRPLSTNNNFDYFVSSDAAGAEAAFRPQLVLNFDGQVSVSDNDTLSGGEGNDMLDGGSGVDLLYGDGGDDRIIIGAGSDGSSVDGGSGTDTLAVSGAVSLGSIANIEAIELSPGANLTLTGAQFLNGLAINTAITGSGTITINIDTPIDYLFAISMSVASTVSFVINGSSATDVIKAANVSNTIFGGAGSDFIRGSNQIDHIDGGADGDKIIGAGGADILTGGGGIDQFRYFAQTNSGTGAAADHITDFTSGSDTLNFAFDSDPNTPGIQPLALSYINTQTFHATGAAEVRYGTVGADLRVEIDLNGDGLADMHILLDGLAGQTLDSRDFVGTSNSAFASPGDGAEFRTGLWAVESLAQADIDGNGFADMEFLHHGAASHMLTMGHFLL